MFVETRSSRPSSLYEVASKYSCVVDNDHGKKSKNCNVLGKRWIPQYPLGRWTLDANRCEVALP